MEKIQITEGYLRQCIIESIKKNINESFADTMGRAKSIDSFINSGWNSAPKLYISNGNNSVLLKPGRGYTIENINEDRDDANISQDYVEDTEAIKSNDGAIKPEEQGKETEALRDDSLGNNKTPEETQADNTQQNNQDNNDGRIFTIGIGYKRKSLTLTANKGANISINRFNLKPGIPYIILSGQTVIINNQEYSIF